MKPQRPDTGMLRHLSSKEGRRDLETGSTVGSTEVAIVECRASCCVAGEARGRLSLLPPVPPPPNVARGRWPIDADAPWKSHGRPRSTARTNPSTALSTELGNPANGRRLSTSVNRPRRFVAQPSLSLSLTTNGTYNQRKSGAGNTVNPSTKSGQLQSGPFAPP